MPSDLRQMNIDRFMKLLEGASGPAEQDRIKWLIAEERAKPDTAYPDLNDAPPSSLRPGGRE